MSNYKITYAHHNFAFSPTEIVLNPSKSIPKWSARKALQKRLLWFFSEKIFFEVNLGDNSNFFETFSIWWNVFNSHLISCSDWCQIWIKTIISVISTDFKGKIKYWPLIGWDEKWLPRLLLIIAQTHFFSIDREFAVVQDNINFKCGIQRRKFKNHQKLKIWLYFALWRRNWSFSKFFSQSAGPQYVFTHSTGSSNILYDEKFRPKISRAGS